MTYPNLGAKRPFAMPARYERDIARMDEQQLREALLHSAEVRGMWEVAAVALARGEVTPNAILALHDGDIGPLLTELQIPMSEPVRQGADEPVRFGWIDNERQAASSLAQALLLLKQYASCDPYEGHPYEEVVSFLREHGLEPDD